VREPASFAASRLLFPAQTNWVRFAEFANEPGPAGPIGFVSQTLVGRLSASRRLRREPS